MTEAFRETIHNPADDECPAIIAYEDVPTVSTEEQLKSSSLSRQLGVATIDHLTRALQPEQSPNQELRENMQGLLVGQDAAIDSIITALDRSVFREANKPYCSLLFLGPTGVGKTETARALNSLLHDGEKACLTRIDCSAYQLEHQIADLVGSPPGYVGRGQLPKLRPSVIKGDKHILVFDEFEKAHPSLHKLILQILEDGELAMQNSDNITYFNDCIVILTSNLGAQDMSKALEGRGLGFAPRNEAPETISTPHIQRIVDKAVKFALPPELIGRIDQRVLFNPLSDEQLGEVVQRYSDKLNKRLLPKGLRLYLTDELVSALVASDPERKQYGGRRITKTFNNIIVTRLGEYVSSGSIPPGSQVHAVLDTSNDTHGKTSDDLRFEFFFEPSEGLLEEYKKANPDKDEALTKDEKAVAVIAEANRIKAPIKAPITHANHNKSVPTVADSIGRELQALKRDVRRIGSSLYKAARNSSFLRPKP